jgi:hypothetical protein
MALLDRAAVQPPKKFKSNAPGIKKNPGAGLLGEPKMVILNYSSAISMI